MDQAARGAKALEAGQFADAIEQYTAAIAVHSNAVDYYIKRSTAFQRSSPPDYVSALRDAEHAIILAVQRARKELITQAQLRRAIVLFGMERYADAQFVFGVVKRLDPNGKTLAIWDAKVSAKLKDLPADDPRGQQTVDEMPAEATPPPTDTKPAAPTQTPSEKIRHDWYQSQDTVSVTLLAKGVPKDQAQVEISERSISITFPTVTGSTFEYTLDPLFASVTPSASSYRITPSKVEFTLKKSVPGQKWSTLEGYPSDSSPTVKPPTYPSSSKHGAKDWDRMFTKDEPSKKVGEGQAADSDDEGDDINKFFKQLYKNADPDVRRAMVKSYQESNGTALSTNWSEVSKAQVETLPPEGMEAKQWNK